MNRFQKVVVACYVSVVALIFIGAIVRATGAGLGCPDWPKCYGSLIPPTRADQIDFTKLDLEKFRQKAARHGIDPATITPESLRANFNAVATWTEYLNRLSSMPVGVTSLAVFILGLGQFRKGRYAVALASVSVLALVLVNAWLGAKVVFSGLKPGIITLHMGLAILLICVLVFAGWRACEERWKVAVLMPSLSRKLLWVASGLFALIVIEGVMGSQVREMTDQLAKSHLGQSRDQWVGELESTMVYLVHRSFSWLIVAMAIAYYRLTQRHLETGARWLERGIVALVFAQMALGVILSNVGILKIAQVLHIGLSSLLVSGLFLWLLGLLHYRRQHQPKVL